MAEEVTITINAINEASAAFESVQQASGETSQAIQSNWEQAEAAGEGYSESLEGASMAQEGVSQSGEEVVNSLEGSWSEASLAVEDYDQSIAEVEASKESFGDSSDGILAGIEENWFAVGAASATVAAGLTGFTNSAQDAEVIVGRLATATGLTEKELRSMGREMADATRTYEEAVGIMEMGTKMGLESREELQEFANVWDLVGDATGENAVRLAESSTALGALGIETNNQREALDALGYVSQRTTMSVGDFLQMTQKTAPELNELGIGVDEMAALLGAMEHELSLTGREARRGFRQALNQSDGTLKGLLETLGLTEAQLKEYLAATEGGEEVLETNADKYADTRTVLQELKASFEGILGTIFPVTQAFSALVPMLALLGPAIKGVTLAKAKLTGVTWGLTAAKTALLGVVGVLTAPIWLVVAAVTAVIAIFVLFNDEIKAVAGFIKDVLIGAFVWIKDTIIDIIPTVRDSLSNAFSTAFDAMKNIVPNIFTLIKETFFGILDFLKGIPRQFFEIGANMITSIIDGIVSKVRNAVNAVKNAVGNIVSAAKGAIGMSSPAKAFIEIGEGMGEGMAVGLDEMDKDLIKAGKQSSELVIKATENTQRSDSGQGHNSKGQSNNITQNITVNSPKPLDEKGIRKENDKMLRELALSYNM